MRQAFQELRQALLEAPGLALPDPAKPFQLFVDEKQGVGKGVLTQPGDLGGGLWHISLNDWTQWLRDGCPVSVSLRLLLSLSMMLTTDLWTEPPGLHSSCDRGDPQTATG